MNNLKTTIVTLIIKLIVNQLRSVKINKKGDGPLDIIKRELKSYNSKTKTWRD